MSNFRGHCTLYVLLSGNLDNKIFIYCLQCQLFSIPNGITFDMILLNLLVTVKAAPHECANRTGLL